MCLCENVTVEDSFDYITEQVSAHEYALDTDVVTNVTSLLISSISSKTMCCTMHWQGSEVYRNSLCIKPLEKSTCWTRLVLSVFLQTDFCMFKKPVTWHDKSCPARLVLRNISVMHSKLKTCALVAILTRGQDHGHLGPGLWPHIICKLRHLLHTQNWKIGNLEY